MISVKVCTGFSHSLAYTLRLSLHKKRSFLIVFPVFFAAGRSENGITKVLLYFAPLGGGRSPQSDGETLRVLECYYSTLPLWAGVAI